MNVRIVGVLMACLRVMVGLGVMGLGAANVMAEVSVTRPAVPGGAVPWIVPEATLVRLFTTPEQRAELQRLRRIPPQPKQPIQPKTTDTETVEPPPQVVSVGGYVTRSRGAPTAWVNGRAVTGFAPELGLGTVDAVLISRGQVGVKPGGIAMRLKPGQSWDPATLQVVDAYQKAARQDPFLPFMDEPPDP